MKEKVVDGTVFLCPTYVVRAKNGWQLRLPNVPTEFFSDTIYGDEKKSFVFTIKVLVLKDLPNGLYYPSASQERINKKRPTGIPGVFLLIKDVKGKIIQEYQLQIRVSGMPTRSLYIGTTNTWESLYEEKLTEAKQIREEMIIQLMEKSYPFINWKEKIKSNTVDAFYFSLEEKDTCFQ